MKKTIFYIIVLLYAYTAKAQSSRIHTNNANGWYIYNGDHKVSDKWGVHLEVQWRAHNIITGKQQFMFRPGINYHFSPQAFATIGYCFAETWPYGEFPVKAAFPEHRLYEQVQYKSIFNRFEVVNRIRMEQRWLYLPVLKNGDYSPGDAVYQNRVRVLNKASVPFKGKTISDKSFYLTLYDEFMINFGKHVGYNIFDQNRACIALGYKIPKVGRLEVGFLEQTILKSDGIKVEHNHTLQVGLTSNVDFYKKNKL